MNRKAVDEPETVNEDPYGERLARPHPGRRPGEAAQLMDAAAYRAHIAEL